MSQQIETNYAVQLDNRDRSTVIWRAILVAPVAVFASSFAVNTWDNSGYSSGLLVLPVVLALLFRGVYPSYVLTFNKALFSLTNRIWAYFALLSDQYPSIEEGEVVTISYPEIEGGKTLSRGLPLIKWAMAIPLYIVGIAYAIYAFVLIVLGWFSIVLNGSLPPYCADGIVRTGQFWNRVYGYAILLVTDEYPTFTL